MTLLGLAACRIWLSADEGIRARYGTHDDLCFIRSAAVGYWGYEKFDNLSLIRTPAYPLWLWANMQLGIPQRLAIDTAYVASALLLVYAMRRVGMSAIWSVITFVVVAFAPETFRLFGLVLSDCLMVVMMNAMCASLLLVMVSRRKVLWGIVAGLFAGLFALTRSEGEVFALGLCACVGALLFLRSYFAREGIRRAAWWGLRVAAVPMVLVLLMTNSAKYANYRVYGIYALSDLSAPGHSAMIKALTRIRPSNRIDYVSISQESMQRAYEVSPSLRELQPHLEGEAGRRWHTMSAIRRPSIPAGEVLSGVNQWLIRDAAQRAGKYASGAEADRFYAQIAKEVNAGIDSGELSARLVLSSFLDPDFGWWVPRLGQSLRNIWCTVTQFGDLPVLMDTTDLTEKVKTEFDRVCVRGANANPESLVVMTGTVTTPGMPAKQIRVFNRPGIKLLASSKVTDIKRSATTQPTFTGDFSVEIPRALPGLFVQWRAMLNNNKESSANRQLPDKAQLIPIPDGGPGARINVKNVDVRMPPVTQRLKIRRKIGAAYDYMAPVIICAGPVFAVCAILVRRRRLRWAWLCCAAVLGFAALSRLGLFAIIDANSWHGDQQRYIFPAVPALLSCCLLLMAGALKDIFTPARASDGQGVSEPLVGKGESVTAGAEMS